MSIRHLFNSTLDPLWTEECVSEPECVSVCDTKYSSEHCHDIPVTMCTTVHSKVKYWELNKCGPNVD